MEFMVDIFPVLQLLLQVGSSLNDQQISPIVDPSLRLEGIECPAPSPKLRFTYRGLDGLEWEEQWATCDCDSLLGAKVEES